LNSATGTPGLEDIERFWGHAYTFSHDPSTCPGKPYAARRKDRKGTIRAATPAHLLDAIKDDAGTRPFTPDPA